MFSLSRMCQMEFIKFQRQQQKNVSTSDKENWISYAFYHRKTKSFWGNLEWKSVNYCTINFKLSYHLGAFVPWILFSCELCSGPTLHHGKKCEAKALKVPKGKLTFIPHVKLNLFSWENWKSFVLFCVGRAQKRKIVFSAVHFMTVKNSFDWVINLFYVLYALGLHFSCVS